MEGKLRLRNAQDIKKLDRDDYLKQEIKLELGGELEHKGRNYPVKVVIKNDIDAIKELAEDHNLIEVGDEVFVELLADHLAPEAIKAKKKKKTSIVHWFEASEEEPALEDPLLTD